MQDDKNDCLLEQSKKEEETEQERVNAFIEEVSDELSRSQSGEEFNPDEEAKKDFLAAMGKTNQTPGEDEQTRRFRQFLSIATNFSSIAFAQRLQKIPELVESIKQLLENMKKEVQEYGDMANELHDLIQCFVRMVMQVKHNVNMMLPLLTAAQPQIAVIQDVMNIGGGAISV